jgi:hypothetical protein
MPLRLVLLAFAVIARGGSAEAYSYGFGSILRWQGLSTEAIAADAIARSEFPDDVERRSTTELFATPQGVGSTRISVFVTGAPIPFTVLSYYSWRAADGGRTWLLATSFASNWRPFGVAAPAPMPVGIAGRVERVVECTSGAIVFIEEHEQRESVWQDPFEPPTAIRSAPWKTRISRVDTDEIRSRVVKGRPSPNAACRMLGEGRAKTS